MKKSLLVLLLAFVAAQCFAQFSDAPIVPTECNIGIRIVSETETLIEPISYYKTKVNSGAFLSGFKTKNLYKGASSPNKAKVGDRFIFSFGEVPESLKLTMYMFGSQYSIRNFQLAKLKSKKERRELVTGEMKMSGYDSGVEECTDIEFDVAVAKENTYVVTITSAKPGEYAFVFSDKGVGAYQSIFDFSVQDSDKGYKRTNKYADGDYADDIYGDDD